ncbi:DNA repair protein RAD51 homolog 3 [Stigmatopora argus]
MQRSVSTLRLNPQVKVKVLNAGFHMLDDIMQVSALELCRETGLSQEEALEVLQAVRKEGGAEEDRGSGNEASLTALDLLQKEEELNRIVTFSSRLDAALGGGLPVGKTTEICGAPGVGKTQLCLQLAVDAQVPPCFGGLGGQVLFIDTEGSFMVQRVVDLASAAVRHCTLIAEDAEQRDAVKAFTVESILSNIFLVRCHDYVELLAEIYLLPDFLSRHPTVRLLVIDSVAFPFRQHIDELRSQRTRLLNGLAQQLISAAIKYDLAVVLSNQMTTRVHGGRSELVPALGETWGHAPTQRLLLRWSGSQRQATIFKSPDRQEATVNYQITADGFRDDDDDQSEEPPSKRPRTNTDQSAAL